jgi:glutamate/tyrosine decarboxylase-like PLP-dependent enzyme
MHPLLTQDHQNINGLLREVQRLATGYFANQTNLAPGRFVADLPTATLPEKGMGGQAAIQYFEQHMAPYISNSAGPRYFGFVTGGSTPASLAGDWLVSTYDQNAFGSNDSIAPQVERQTLHFFKQLFGLDAAYFGSFVTGATVSNMVSLAVARQWVGEQRGHDFSNQGLQGTVNVISGTPHSSIIKSLAMLGIGRQHAIKVATLADREAVSLEALEQALQTTEGPCIVVANAGTVNTVDFDDLAAIAKLKEKYRFWLHVDAAFGGFAALSPRFAHLMNGINAADSITIDAHKWLNVPYDAAMQFTRHQSLQLKVFQNSAAYLGDPAQSPDYFHYTPENSRRWRALPSWFTLMAYGKDGHREIVERNCSLAMQLGAWIDQSRGYRLLAPVRMNVVCFTLKDTQLTTDMVRQLLERVRDDGRVFFTPTVYKGTPAIRAAFSNWLTTEEDVKITIDVLEQLR